MNARTIEISQDTALAKLSEYRRLNEKTKTAEDRRLERLYKTVSNGARVINIFEAFRTAGCNDLGQPKLAIARADWQTVYFHSRCYTYPSQDNDRQYLYGEYEDRTGCFNDCPTFHSSAYAKTISLRNVFPKNLVSRWSGLKTAVPHIPPSVRPKIKLSNFHILFEVEKWDEYSVDPFLLRHISGSLYVVIAEWELTELEASLLSSIRSGN